MLNEKYRFTNTSVPVGHPFKEPAEAETSVLRYLRRVNNLSQRQLAEITGISQRKIRSFEAGYRTMRLREVKQLANYFAVSLHALVENDFAEVVNRVWG